MKPWEQLEVDVLANPPPGWYVAKQHPEVRKFDGVWTPTDKGEPDFMAVHPSLGGILFDVKHTNDARWAVCKDGPVVRGKPIYVGLQPHQRASLKRFAALTMTAGVLVRFPIGDVWYPIGTIEPLWKAWWDEAKEVRKVRYLVPGDGVPVVGMRWDLACR